MKYSTKHLIGKKVHAKDDTFGSCQDLLFDAYTKRIRYLVVDTGNWLPGRQVLISPQAISLADGESLEDGIPLSLTREQIENSPPLSKEMPISRAFQQQLFNYYGWEPYAAVGPASASMPTAAAELAAREAYEQNEESDLQAASRIFGYTVRHSDGTDGGKVDDIYFDSNDWRLSHAAVKTGLLVFTDRKLISMDRVSDLAYEVSVMYTRLSEEEIADAPDAPELDLPVSSETERKFEELTEVR